MQVEAIVFPRRSSLSNRITVLIVSKQSRGSLLPGPPFQRFLLLLALLVLDEAYSQRPDCTLSPPVQAHCFFVSLLTGRPADDPVCSEPYPQLLKVGPDGLTRNELPSNYEL